jgi:hypothetical protein
MTWKARPGNVHAAAAERAIIRQRRGWPRTVAVGLLVGGLALTVVPAAVGAPEWSAAASLGSGSTSPQITDLFPGAFFADNAPPDATVAASTTRVIQLTNFRYSITNLAKATTTTGSMSQLVGTPGVFLADPQVIWDPLTKRFYFSVFENRGQNGPHAGLAWGFSKSASPTSATGFCTYFDEFNYAAASFPDRESLGDTADFLLIGSNRILAANESYAGSDVAWISKPPPGHTCPAHTVFKTGIHNLGTELNTAPYVPVPSRQVDSSATGWILATPSYVSASSLSLIPVTKSALGEPLFGLTHTVPVPAYRFPPNAPQAGNTIAGGSVLPLETRIYLTQVIAANDPRVGHEVLWTAHTIAGGAGAEVRWYEINPTTAAVDQSGTVGDPSLYVFNGAISPDRIVSGRTKAFGSNAVVTVNTSSASTDAAIQMVGVTGSQPQSGLVMVQQSPGPNVDFTCSEPHTTACRWGDYAGATPDPGAPTSATTGRVWLTNQWNLADLDDNTPVWRTTIWRATP